jgi:hypothetical protein
MKHDWREQWRQEHSDGQPPEWRRHMLKLYLADKARRRAALLADPKVSPVMKRILQAQE